MGNQLESSRVEQTAFHSPLPFCKKRAQFKWNKVSEIGSYIVHGEDPESRNVLKCTIARKFQPSTLQYFAGSSIFQQLEKKSVFCFLETKPNQTKPNHLDLIKIKNLILLILNEWIHSTETFWPCLSLRVNWVVKFSPV